MNGVLRILGSMWLIAALLCQAGAAQESLQRQSKPIGTSGMRSENTFPALPAQELFNRISRSVFVVESMDDAGQAIEQGSAVLIRVEKTGSIAGRFSDRKEKTADNARSSRSNSSLRKGFVPDPACVAFLITNYHVVREGADFRISHGTQTWPAEIVSFDADHDLAELRVSGLKAPAVVIRKSSTLAVGEQAYAIGAPEGLELTISQGLISGLRDLNGTLQIQTSAPISPGSSGGGLFDSRGRLVGITAAFLKEGENLNFAIPAELALSLEPSANPLAPGADAKLDAELDVYIGAGFLQQGLKAEDNEKLAPNDRRSVAAIDYGIAVRHLQEAVRLKPDDEEAWKVLGGAYFLLTQYQKAAETEEQAIRLEPDDEEAWKHLGSLYSILEQYDKALAAEQQAVALRPDDEGAWKALGIAYNDVRQYDKAVSAEQQAIALKGDDDSAWVSLGQAYLALERDNDAATAEREALNINPKSESAWQSLGAAYDNLRLYKEAANAEQSAIALDPNDATALFNLGMAYWGLGQRAEVIKVYQKLKTLDQQEAADFFTKFVLPN